MRRLRFTFLKVVIGRIQDLWNCGWTFSWRSFNFISSQKKKKLLTTNTKLIQANDIILHKKMTEETWWTGITWTVSVEFYTPLFRALSHKWLCMHVLMRGWNILFREAMRVATHYYTRAWANVETQEKNVISSSLYNFSKSNMFEKSISSRNDILFCRQLLSWRGL